MPYAYLQEFEATDDRMTANYDAVVEKLGTDQNPPDGLVIHTAGFGEDGTFRIFDVWESREHAERFQRERLMPAVQEVTAGRDAPPPSKDEMYELHHVVPARS